MNHTLCVFQFRHVSFFSAYTYLKTLLLLTHYITIGYYAKMLKILQPYPYPVMPELGGPGGPLAPPPQYLADQLTLFQPGRQIIPTYYYWHPQCFSPTGISAFK